MIEQKTSLYLLLLGLLATGCASVQPGVKTAAFNPRPERLFIWSHLDDTKTGVRFEQALTKGFTDRFAADLEACGAKVTVYSETGVELDDKAFRAAAEASNADTLLVIQKRKGQLDKAGRLDWAYYVFEFFASPDPGTSVFAAAARGKKPVSAWKGESLLSINYPWTGFDGEPFAQQGALQAAKATNRLKAEGFYPGCAPIAIPGTSSSSPQQ